MTDIIAVANYFNISSESLYFKAYYDINGDNAINMTDIMIIARHFNTSAADYEGYISPTTIDTPTPKYTPTRRPPRLTKDPYTVTCNISPSLIDGNTVDISVDIETTGRAETRAMKLVYWEKSNPEDKITVRINEGPSFKHAFVTQIETLSPNTAYCLQLQMGMAQVYRDDHGYDYDKEHDHNLYTNTQDTICYVCRHTEPLAQVPD